jgi:DNA-directed RNA polymerase subunit N (RpoN/RPB10)
MNTPNYCLSCGNPLPFDAYIELKVKYENDKKITNEKILNELGFVKEMICCRMHLMKSTDPSLFSMGIYNNPHYSTF